MDSYADAPVSIAELRADREGDAKIWTPRDAIIQLLREIDNGKQVDICVICYREVNGPDTRTRYVAAGGSNLNESLGLLTRATYMMNLQ